MIATALFLAAASAATPLSPEVANEILVVGQRLERDWRGKLAKRDGRLACKTARSTGDVAIDCGAMLHCTLAVEPQMDALAADRTLSGRDRRRQMDTLVQSTVPCMDDYRNSAIVRLAAARAQS